MTKTSLKNVLFVHHTDQVSGATRSLSYILKGMDRNKYNISLLNIGQGPANDIFREIGIEPMVLKNSGPFHGSTVVDMNWKIVIKNLIKLIPTIYYSYRVIKSLSPDLIHLNSTCLFPIAIAAKLYNTQLPVTIHVREPLRVSWYGVPLRYFSKKYADGFIAISEFDLGSLKIGEKDVHASEVIYNFVDQSFSEEKENKNLKKELGIKDDDIVFLYLARFANSNGWKELLSYADQIIQNRSNCHFILAGAYEGINTEKYSTEKIHILRFREDVKPLLNTADIYVCPFTEPHFARGIIEAADWGLPTLAHNIGGVNELVVDGETGFLYNNPEEFYTYSIKLIDDSILRNQFKQSSKKFATLNFSFDKNLKATLKFIDSFM